MTSIVFVAWEKDLAGMNIKACLEKIGFVKLSTQNIKLDIKVISKQHIFADNLDKEIKADLFVFCTTHRSSSDKKSLCVHPIGNMGNENKLGGLSRKIVPCIPNLMKKLLIEITKLKPEYDELEDYDATIEQTHHGPYLETPAMFVEIGSTEDEWKTKQAGEIIAKSLYNVFNEELKKEQTFERLRDGTGKNVCIIGGGHYNQLANKIVHKTKLNPGHILTKFYLEETDENMLKQMKEKSNADMFVFDWKSCGPEKHRITRLLDELGFKWVKSKRLFS